MLTLSQPLTSGNRDRLQAPVSSVTEFVDMFGEIFRHQHRYRGLVLALPYAIETFDAVRDSYRGTERQRRVQVLSQLCSLRERGALCASDEALRRIVSHITLIARFWIGEAATTYRRHALGQVIAHYQALIADLLWPYASEAARHELACHRAGWIDLDG